MLACAMAAATSSPALADPEGSHPLVDRPFPAPSGVRLGAPCAVLIWRAGDSRSLRLLGEAKLKELLSQRPELRIYSLEVRDGAPGLLPPEPSSLVRFGHVPGAYLKQLQAPRTPFIVTVDRQGLVHRVSYVDHWPVLSAVEARFGKPPVPRASWWQRVRQLFGRD